MKLHVVSPEYIAEAKGAAFASADDKYMHLLKSMHAYEKEVQHVRKENDEMWESQPLLREENAELHVLVKKAMAMAMQAGNNACNDAGGNDARPVHTYSGPGARRRNGALMDK